MLRSIKEVGEFIELQAKIPHRRDKLASLKGKSKELYDIITSQAVPNDQIIFKTLYPNGSKKTYLKLKERLYHHLIDIAFGLEDSSKKIGFSQIRERSIKQASMLRIFLFKGLPFNVEEASKNLINVCQRYEFNDLLRDILLVNLELYGRGYQNESKFNKLHRQYKCVTKIVKIENEIQVKYFKFFVDYATSNKLSKPDTRAQLDSDEQFFLQVINDKPSVKSVVFAYNALCIINELIGQHDNIVKLAEKALKYLHSKPQDNKILQLSFWQKIFRAQLKLGRKADLFKTIHEIEERTTKYSIPYYQTALYRMLMWCHSGQYAKVLDELSKVYFKKLAQRVPENIKEYFNIMHGFIAFLEEAEVFDSGETKIEKFRVFKFINEVPIFSKDKKGVNISILILHVLFMLQRRRYDDIIERVESLQLYSYRYLRKGDTFRSNCFIKMIIQMTKANFHPIRTERYTAELKKKLLSSPLELSDQPLEVEVIPYEHLWEVVMQLLERNSKIKRGRPKSNN